MRLPSVFLAATAAATALGAGAAQAAQVEIRDAVARVTVIPENRTDVRVEVIKAHPKLPLNVRVEAGRTIVDGGLERRLRGCGGEHSGVRIRDVGKVDWDDAPQVVIRTPRDVDVVANGAIRGAVGRSASLKLANSGCGSWTVADVAGPASIHESGAGQVRMGASQRLTVRVSGAGGIEAAQVREGLDASLSGAGGVTIRDFSGDMTAQVSGVGQVEVEHGRARTLKASISGVGGIDFDGPVETLDASIAGFGGVTVKSVSGQVRKSVSGIGKVTIEDRP